MIVDTKWKLIRDGRPSDADLKQMFVYNLFWQTDRSILLYPGAITWSGDWGRFHRGNPLPKSEVYDDYHYCKVATLKVWKSTPNGPSLRKSIAQDILGFTSQLGS